VPSDDTQNLLGRLAVLLAPSPVPKVGHHGDFWRQHHFFIPSTARWQGLGDPLAPAAANDPRPARAQRSPARVGSFGNPRPSSTPTSLRGATDRQATPNSKA
jgi:hypothetical protein